jgi:hypothetical protein
MGLGNNGLLVGGAGAVLVVLGSILVGSGTGPFVLGLVVLLVGVGLIVRLLLQLTESAGTRTAGAAKHNAGSSTGSALGGFFNITGMSNMSAMSQWAAGALMGALSLLGLFLYSRADDGMFGLFGGLLFLFGLAVIVVFVHKATDYSTEAHDEAADENNSDQAAA